MFCSKAPLLLLSYLATYVARGHTKGKPVVVHRRSL